MNGKKRNKVICLAASVVAVLAAAAGVLSWFLLRGKRGGSALDAE